MAVYGNISVQNSLLEPMTFVTKEATELEKIVESYNVLTEGCILTEANTWEYLKLLGKKFLAMLVKFKNAIINFFKQIRIKVRNSLGSSKNVTIKDLEVVDVKDYIERWNKIDDKYKVVQVLKDGMSSSGFHYGTSAFNKMEQAGDEGAAEVQKMLDEMKDNVSKCTIANKKASDILNELDNMNTRKVLATINDGVNICNFINNAKADFKMGNVNEILNKVTKYFTLSSSVWGNIQKYIVEIYKQVITYVKNNKGNSSNSSSDNKSDSNNTNNNNPPAEQK